MLVVFVAVLLTHDGPLIEGPSIAISRKRQARTDAAERTLSVNFDRERCARPRELQAGERVRGRDQLAGEALEAIAAVNDRHGHIQEIILQNFVPHRRYYGEEPAEVATEAAEAYRWLADIQRPDGSWWNYYLPDGTVDTTGSWKASVNDGEPGIIMPAHPKSPNGYRQEYLKGAAGDMGWTVQRGGSVRVSGRRRKGRRELTA